MLDLQLGSTALRSRIGMSYTAPQITLAGARTHQVSAVRLGDQQPTLPNAHGQVSRNLFCSFSPSSLTFRAVDVSIEAHPLPNGRSDQKHHRNTPKINIHHICNHNRYSYSALGRYLHHPIAHQSYCTRRLRAQSPTTQP